MDCKSQRQQGDHILVQRQQERRQQDQEQQKRLLNHEIEQAGLKLQREQERLDGLNNLYDENEVLMSSFLVKKPTLNASSLNDENKKHTSSSSPLHTVPWRSSHKYWCVLRKAQFSYYKDEAERKAERVIPTSDILHCRQCGDQQLEVYTREKTFLFKAGDGGIAKRWVKMFKSLIHGSSSTATTAGSSPTSGTTTPVLAGDDNDSNSNHHTTCTDTSSGNESDDTGPHSAAADAVHPLLPSSIPTNNESVKTTTLDPLARPNLTTTNLIEEEVEEEEDDDFDVVCETDAENHPRKEQKPPSSDLTSINHGGILEEDKEFYEVYGPDNAEKLIQSGLIYGQVRNSIRRKKWKPFKGELTNHTLTLVSSTTDRTYTVINLDDIVDCVELDRSDPCFALIVNNRRLKFKAKDDTELIDWIINIKSSVIIRERIHQSITDQQQRSYQES